MSAVTINDDKLKQYETILLNENMLFELNAIPQMVVNKDRIIIRANKKFTLLFGYTNEEILGKQTVVLTPSKEKFEEYKKHFTQTKDGIIKSEELEYKKKDGTIFWVKLEGNPINQQEEELFILWSFIDVTNEVNYRNELKHLASVDPMTNLFNRRYFTKTSELLLALAKRKQTSSAVIMLDIDKFKLVNDNYGHAVGDEVIIALSSILQENSRKSDIVSRWGGEEFVILLLETSLDGAIVIAEKIRLEVESLSLDVLHDKKIHFTVSIGVSLVNIELDNNIESSINRADKALYEAKENGRNQVCIKT